MRPVGAKLCGAVRRVALPILMMGDTDDQQRAARFTVANHVGRAVEPCSFSWGGTAGAMPYESALCPAVKRREMTKTAEREFVGERKKKQEGQ